LTRLVRTPTLLVTAFSVLVLAPAAAAEPVRTLSVAPERALSATLTLPKKGKVRLENGPRKLTIKVDEDGDDLLVRGVDLGRNRVPRTARLIVSSHDGITSVTLGAGVVAQTASRTVRLRGVTRLADRYASSVADPVDRLAQRAGMLHLARPRTQAYLGQGLDGALHYRELRNWAAAFLPGLLWQVAAERNSVLHARWAMEEVRDLRTVAAFDDPDIGFVFWRAAQVGYDHACATPVPRLGLSARSCSQLGSLARQAADRLVARAASNVAGLIPTQADESLCSQCLPGEARIIVDQLHNLPVLSESRDPGRRALALKQARWVAANLLRPDGAAYQQGFISRIAGVLTRTGNFQGFDDLSVWSRGRAGPRRARPAGSGAPRRRRPGGRLVAGQRARRRAAALRLPRPARRAPRLLGPGHRRHRVRHPRGPLRRHRRLRRRPLPRRRRHRRAGAPRAAGDRRAARPARRGRVHGRRPPLGRERRASLGHGLLRRAAGAMSRRAEAQGG
jgi:hypothetical protein